MVFSSLIFLFFFLPIVLGIYFLLRGMLARNILLLVASLIFYAWGEPTYVWVMLFSIAVNYFFAVWIEDHRALQKKIVTAAVVFNISLLAIFKYSGFFSANLNEVLGRLHLPQITPWDIPLPLGVSFFTFHALSYVIDVFRKQAGAQRNPINLALYICFFPQLIAGPIIRYHDICGQLTDRKVTIDMFSEGITRFIGGLGKKVLIANVVAQPIDVIFGLPPSEMSFALSWAAGILYVLQVYFDFAGYSDMAVGLGLMFGFRFLENFNYPYVSQSMRELWNRWHISLSNWFRDYLFRPIGGFRRNKPIHTASLLMVVFFCCGLWHGASWHYVLWGIYNGLFVSIERLGLGKLVDAAPRPIRHLYVLLVWTFGVVLFRAETAPQAFSMWGNMLGFGCHPESFYTVPVLATRDVCLATVVGILASTPVFRNLLFDPTVFKTKSAPAGTLVQPQPTWFTTFGSSLKLAFPLVLEGTIMAVVIMQLASGAYNPFIYFRF